MKILLITYNLGGSASGKVTERVVRELVSQGVEVKVLTSSCVSESIPCEVIEVKNKFIKFPLLKRVQQWLYRHWISDQINGNYVWRHCATKQGKRIIVDWKPDWIIARSTPFDACIVGIKLKKECEIKLLSHFTDPLPAPIEYCPFGKVREYRLMLAKSIIENSDKVSMGTQEAILYEQDITGRNISSKVFVSPDSSPSQTLLFRDSEKNESFDLVFLGEVYGSRNIYPLLEAIEKLRDNGSNILLHIYSDKRLNDVYRDYIIYEGRTKDVVAAMSKADMLIDIDGDDKTPVFVSSKLKDYLTINRPILSITPNNSPSSALLKYSKTAYVVENTPSDIFSALRDIMNYEFLRADFDDRKEILNQFNVSNIVCNLLEQLK